jgi:hypothetical protein
MVEAATNCRDHTPRPEVVGKPSMVRSVAMLIGASAPAEPDEFPQTELAAIVSGLTTIQAVFAVFRTRNTGGDTPVSSQNCPPTVVDGADAPDDAENSAARMLLMLLR